MQSQYLRSSNGSLYTDLQRRRQAGAAMGSNYTRDQAITSQAAGAADMASFTRSEDAKKRLKSITMENAVVVLSRKGCCMSHVITRLLCSLGVNPTAVEVEEEGAEIMESAASIPAVFIGGRLLGGVDRLLAAHITGNLVPQLKEAGALWL